MMNAIKQGDYESFMQSADPNFKNGVPPQAFLSMSAALAPRLASGYTPTYLTSLNKQGAKTYLWKIVFKDEGDDMLVTLSLRNDKVIGFFIT
jgi:hypothetical protein